MNLKIGGNNVGKIMYGGQEFGGSQMLETGTILLLLNRETEWAKRRLGLDFTGLRAHGSITCKAFEVEKDWKNVSQICVETTDVSYLSTHEIIDISELKNGPQNVGKVAVKLEGNEFTFINSANYSYDSILVEAYNE